MLTLDAIFSEDGPLAGVTGGFRSRPQQQQMAEVIWDAVREHKILIAEAGTGTGKTYAYLVPALLAGGKVVISTGTKTLQDQLYHRDVPQVRQALKVPVIVSLLKGRANYVCHYHLSQAKENGRFVSREDAAFIPLIEQFTKLSPSGDKSELTSVPEEASIWMQVTSTRENCLGQGCPYLKDCFVLEARRKALAADVVIVNHHLFFADLMLKDEGVSELLPASTTVIFDEAHQLPEIATLFFGESLSTGQMLQLARDMLMEAKTSAKDWVELPAACRGLDSAVRDLRLTVSDEMARLSAYQAIKIKGFEEALGLMQERLEEMARILQNQAERASGLQNCLERVQSALALLHEWVEGLDDAWIRWVEVSGHSLHLHATPLSIAGHFGKKIDSAPRSMIFTSATLAVNNDFSHYKEQMGLLEAHTSSWDSPFDYARQALLYVPRGLPDPREANYTRLATDAALPAIEAACGKTFFLFTSLRAMREAHGYLSAAFTERSLQFPLLMQGESTRSKLLERFRNLGNAVLLASQSFWEGVDVRGEALSLVIIDRLPFEPPDDPVLSARIEEMKRKGKNPFMEYQLPHAIITLKQGAGRLIRDAADRGVLMICDPRLVEKPYGQRIWRSLPAMARCRDIQEVIDFFSEIGADVEASGI